MRHVDRTLRDQQVRDDRADVSHRRLERYHAEKAAAGAKST
jgi:hypothetical protein